MSIYVGIDLSYSSTGVVKIDGDKVDCAAFKAGTPKDSFEKRVKELWLKISKFLPPPELCLIGIEGAAYAAEFNAFKLGELSGAIKVYLTEAGYAYTIVQPTVLKKFATGKGNAEKTYVAAQVMRKWGFSNPCNDIVDAFVLAKIMVEGGVEDGTVR
jgi:crossover junction endodeoxyribonuclease RuvC